MGITTPELFHSTVYAKTGGEVETLKKLRAIIRKGDLIALGTATDPYQPGEADLRITHRFLDAVSRERGVRLGITTKGALILRDVDLLRRIHERSSLSIHVSLISLRADLLRRIEPWAPPPDVRLEVMRRLTEAGLDVAHALAPVLPAITDGEGDLDELLARVAAAGVRRMFCNILFLRSPTKEKYLRWVEEAFPQHLDAYRRAYGGRVYLNGRYRERLRALIDRLRSKHGFTPAGGGEASFRRPRRAEQLRLWE
jgi:DNA repair photolyase